MSSRVMDIGRTIKDDYKMTLQIFRSLVRRDNLIIPTSTEDKAIFAKNLKKKDKEFVDDIKSNFWPIVRVESELLAIIQIATLITKNPQVDLLTCGLAIVQAAAFLRGTYNLKSHELIISKLEKEMEKKDVIK